MAASLLCVLLAALLAGASATDLRSRLIPNALTGGCSLAALVLVAVTWPETLPERLAAAALVGGFLLAAALARPGGMGLGDVKLAAAIGLFLGGAAVTALLLALVAGALAGAVLVALRGRAGRHTAIPFAPFLATGAALAWWGADNLAAPWS